MPVPYDHPDAFRIQLIKKHKVEGSALTVAPLPLDNLKRRDILYTANTNHGISFRCVNISFTNYSIWNDLNPSSVPGGAFQENVRWIWRGDAFRDALGVPYVYAWRATSKRWELWKLALGDSVQYHACVAFDWPDSLDEDANFFLGPYLLNAKGQDSPEAYVYEFHPDAPRVVHLLPMMESERVHAKIVSGPGLFYAGAWDLNNDGEDELVFNTASHSNGVVADSLDDRYGYALVYNHAGRRIWKMQTEKGGGDVQSRIEGTPPRFYSIWRCINYTNKPAYSRFYELDPKNGEIKDSMTVQGKAIWPEINSDDSSHWALLINDQEETVQWFSRSFQPSSKKHSISLLMDIAATLPDPNGKGLLYFFTRSDGSLVATDEDFEVVGSFDGRLVGPQQWNGFRSKEGGNLCLFQDKTGGVYTSEIIDVDWFKWRWKHPTWQLVGLILVVIIMLGTYGAFIFVLKKHKIKTGLLQNGLQYIGKEAVALKKKVAATDNEVDLLKKDVEAIEREAASNIKAKQQAVDGLLQLNKELTEKIIARDNEESAAQTPTQAMSATRYPVIIGESQAMRRIYDQMDRIAKADLPVFITGESGTGKELVARALHKTSRRCDKEFEARNCGGLDDHLLKDDLFGHIRGAFTGAVADKRGVIELAEGGTLFLDEIADVPASIQSELLRFLQDGEYQRLGDPQVRHANVRIISATNKSLPDEIQAGRFRNDLYFRLNVLTIELPPLRERNGDIPLLVAAILNRVAGKTGKSERTISNGALRKLEEYSWPGNIRELENVLARAATLAAEEVIKADEIKLPEKSVATSPQLHNSFRSEDYRSLASGDFKDKDLAIRFYAFVNKYPTYAAAGQQLNGLSSGKISHAIKRIKELHPDLNP